MSEKVKGFDLAEKCGCGQEQHYQIKENGVFRGSCNKYRRCPTYDELSEISEKQGRMIFHLQEAMRDVFMTCTAEPGNYYVKIVSKDLKSAQAVHSALCEFENRTPGEIAAKESFGD